MIGDEGLVNTIRIFSKYLGNSEVRNRMKLINTTIRKFADYFGYGIYSFKKT